MHARIADADLDVTRPVGQGDDAGAAFVQGALAIAVRTVVGRQHQLGNVGFAGELGGTHAAVVALVDDQRVLQHALRFQGSDHATDLVVEGGDHGGVGAPGRLGDVRVPVQVLLRRLEGRMRRGEGQVHEHRLLAVVVLDLAHGVVAEQIGGVAFFLHQLVVAIPVGSAMGAMGEIVDLAQHRAVVVVEAALPGPVFLVGMADMPFADHRGVVAGIAQRLRQGVLVGIQAVLAGRGNHRALHAGAVGITTGHQRRTCLRAQGLRVEILQPHAAARQRVDVRRLDVGAVVADILPALVVGDDVDDVGLLGARLRQYRHRPCHGQNQHAEQYVGETSNRFHGAPLGCEDGSGDSRRAGLTTGPGAAHPMRPLRQRSGTISMQPRHH